MYFKVFDFRNPYRRERAAIAVIVLLVMLAAIVSSTAEMLRSAVMASSQRDDKCTVIIDAGHGGEDCGAIGVNGLLEKDVNLAMAFEIGEGLKQAGYNVVYTRTDDKMLYAPEENIKGIRKISDLKNRCKIANGYENAIFVSIHMNSFGQEKYSGLQVYYSVSDKSSLTFAQCIQERVKRDLQSDNKRKVKMGTDMYLMENVRHPAVLVECGFLTNARECEKLSEKEYQKQLSFSIVCGIIEYIDIMQTV